MATSINSVKDSTGVQANLIYDSNAAVTEKANAASQEIGTTAHTAGNADVFNRTALGEITTAGTTNINVSDQSAIKLGQNVDGYGRVYLKMTDDDKYDIYKDAAMTMKVADGTISSNTSTINSANNSGLSGIDLTFFIRCCSWYDLNNSAWRLSVRH